MALKLYQKRFKKHDFCQKADNFMYFRPYDFIKNSLACGTNIV